MKKLFLLATIMMCGCSDGGNEIDEPAPKEDAIEFSKSELSFDVSGGKQSIYVYSSKDWTLSGGASWCIPSQDSGSDWDEIVFTIAENDEVEKRGTTFSFSCGTATETLTITQSHGELIVSPSKIEIEAVGGEAMIEIKTTFNYDYQIDNGCEDWITLKDSHVLQTTKLAFHIAQNKGRENREGKITFYFGEFSETVIIYQAGEKPLDVTVHVPQNGMLEAALANYDYSKIESLTITGVIGELDFYLIRNQLPQLLNLDISATNTSVIPSQALMNSKLEKCILPRNLISIGEKAFYNSRLTSIMIPTNIEIIDRAAFQNCLNLAELKFGQGSKLKTIKGGYDTSESTSDYGTFSRCSALTSVEIPANVEIIEAAAFLNCVQLKSVTFEKNSNLIKIKGGRHPKYEYQNYGAFTDCTALKSIEIPANVEIIEMSAFLGCTQLSSVTFEAGSKLETIGGSRFQRPHGAFSNCTALISIEIPASVTTIGFAAFYGCSNLSKVIFEKPSLLKSLDGDNTYGYGAFANCTALTSIEIPASIETIAYSIFSGCSNLAVVSFENGSALKNIISYTYTMYSGTFAQLDNLTTFDASTCKLLESIGAQTFNRNPKLTTIKIGATTPPICSEAAFVEMNANCILKVPSESVAAYKIADGWKTFTAIMAF